MTKSLESWRASAFARVDPSIVESVRRIAACILDKQLEVRWQWLRAHNGNPGNERADELAAQGAREMKKELAAEAELLRRASSASRRGPQGKS